MNKDRHKDYKFCDYDKAVLLVNNPLFRELEEIDTEHFEVRSHI